MADQSTIEWTRGDDGHPGATWNPLTGCTKVSPGCDNCYAETFAERFRGVPGHPYEQGFDLQLRPERLDQPIRWKRPRRIFVNSMSDLFQYVPDEFIAQVFAVMAATPRHTYQLLTKRHARMRSLLSDDAFVRLVHVIGHRDKWGWPAGGEFPARLRWPLTNVWLGVSVENQKWADIRIPALLGTPAAVRWISAEPLLGPVDLHAVPGADGVQHARHLDWVVVGGESGPGARPMHPDWARSLRDQCMTAGVPFLFKQAGTVLAREWGGKGKGGDPAHWPEQFPREYPTAEQEANRG